ncbi:hypothetical protein SOVF_078350 isoform B [Spinacia oleracea]|uniref:Uncharacterized protein isoform X3 n=1 Tax=Spinacia oleracea TaxID=3562 RepID=A0A9R0JLI9_SPIOL|nr:uncharacterized protein LOC110778480 isoform X3 [Spinacia oleracea]KNA17641.1 hypothetical protein SOVF_078350 isoform B [Spinacia oleracea]
MAAAIAPPFIQDYHHSFYRRHFLSPAAASSFFPTTAITTSLRRLHVFKAHNSLQINHDSNQQQSRYSPPSTLVPSTSHSRDSNNLPSIPRNSTDAGGCELRAVLELATNSELFEIEKILFGPSYLSPLLKSVSSGVELDRFMIEEDFEERDHFIEVLESRFLYLAADARSTLRDRDTAAAIKVGTAELCSVLLKGGQLISMLKISELVTTRLSGKLLFEAAKHKLDGEFVKKGLIGSASQYFGFRSLGAFVGPLVWGTLLADIVIQMLGTDYIRILQAIYAFAQIRILRRHGLYLDKLRAGF